MELLRDAIVGETKSSALRVNTSWPDFSRTSAGTSTSVERVVMVGVGEAGGASDV
jgi:hypothetical protein